VRTAALLAVGDELLSGAQADSNSAWLARQLAGLGFTVLSVELVGDEEADIAAALGRALTRAELVCVGGGLGPTLDDVTRHGVARALGLELSEDAATVMALESWFKQRRVPMSATNRRQALFPVGATVLANRVGTAPGFRLELDGRAVLVLPGPPRELEVVWHEEVVPWLESSGRAQPARAEHSFYLFGLPESQFAERTGAWMARDAEPLLGCTVRDGTLTATLRARVSGPDGRARLAARAAEFRARFVEHIYSEAEWALERVLASELFARGLSITVAESCTGGLLQAYLTGVPGISRVFAQGIVSYADEAKERLLGVPHELLAEHGAVSREVAEAMARGAARASRAELALAVTGIAGPNGGSAEKPVGLVWFAVAQGEHVTSVERRFPPSERETIRRLAARTALFLAWRRVCARD
jgi:nicotinamide-nucleotide amidase